AGIVLGYFPGENIFISAVDPDNWDKLWVKFQGAPDGTIRDCNDLYGVTGTAIKVRFYSRTTSAADGTPSTAYYCERQNNNTTYTYSDVPSGTVIIPSTVFSQAMIRCGEDISIYNYVNRWVFCTDVIDRTKVYAIRVAFLLHSRDPVRASNVTQSFYVFNQTISYTDKYLHRLYFFTVLLPYAPNVTKMFQWLS
ncbi:MAG TPA: hypothetical protein VLG38_00380, partial [Gammaproteobacteria bacterium]|nr:hypothetical protein [Gammaproteobacteria bacterium]